MPVKRHLLYLILAAPVIAMSAPPLQCDIGPITKVFGTVPWLLYSCDDDKSLVVVSAPGSAAAPFYFFFSPEGRDYHLRGEGTGSKTLTDAALKELRVLSREDIAGLVAQTIASRNSAPKR
jgi:hypothetical protein